MRVKKLTLAACVLDCGAALGRISHPLPSANKRLYHQNRTTAFPFSNDQRCPAAVPSPLPSDGRGEGQGEVRAHGTNSNRFQAFSNRKLELGICLGCWNLDVSITLRSPCLHPLCTLCVPKLNPTQPCANLCKPNQAKNISREKYPTATTPTISQKTINYYP